MNTLLKSKLGTRMAVLFIVCALVPIVILSVVAFVEVTRQLEKDARKQLRDECRASAQAILERFSFAERELMTLAQVVTDGHDPTPYLGKTAIASAQQDLHPFASVTCGIADDPQTILGQPLPWHDLTPEQEQHLQSGRTVMIIASRNMRGRYLELIRATPTPEQPSKLIRARINDEYLWTSFTARKSAEMSQFCVLDAAGRTVYAYAPVTPAFSREIDQQIRAGSVDLFDWEEHGRKHLVSYRNVFLNYKFSLPRVTVVTARPVDLVFAPIKPFQSWFPLLVMLCVWVVLFLTLYEVRRRLIPLRKLIDGTRQIAGRHFDHRVNIATGDEFDELAGAFNAMADKIGRQLETLSIIGDIDRGLLAAIEMDEIVGKAIDGLARVFRECSVTLATLRTGHAGLTRVYVHEPGDSALRIEEVDPISEREHKRLKAWTQGVEFAGRKNLPPYLSPIRNRENQRFLVLPILLKEELEGVIAIGFGGPSLPQADVEHLHQIANQIALAMANANLVQELQKQNWGIVHALARAVDAKSSWTQGHTERVTKLSLIIAKEMGYDHRQLEELERGALLHDIGKIGITSAILDKQAQLTDKERLVVREHPRMGRRITEPAGMSDEILNIISQHHERYDGKGYPLGLSGEAISLSARIVGVADVTDAVAADRPYRKGMPFSDVIELIARDSGKAFDPSVVAACLRIAENVQSLEELLAIDDTPRDAAPTPRSTASQQV